MRVNGEVARRRSIGTRGQRDFKTCNSLSRGEALAFYGAAGESGNKLLL